jgi:hypothetical protein
MNHHYAWASGLVCLAIACGGASSGKGGEKTGGGSQPSTLEYEEPCAPASCPGALPGDTSAATCSPSASGACGWSAGAGNDGVTSYRACAASECGPIPAIACADGFDAAPPQCGSTNDGPCAYTIVCTARDTGRQCPEADGCGPMPLYAPICDGNVTGTLECHETTAGCAWKAKCP